VIASPIRPRHRQEQGIAAAGQLTPPEKLPVSTDGALGAAELGSTGLDTNPSIGRRDLRWALSAGMQRLRPRRRVTAATFALLAVSASAATTSDARRP
jgi:hypothetical protein